MATIRDVARAADVSIATVSRVLNGSPRVSDSASQRVLTAADELDYWPNRAARSLTTQRTHVLGVLLPDLYGEFFSEVIRGIDITARLLGYQILISSSHADTEEVVSAARSMRGRIDGMILMAPDKGAAEALDRVSRRFPVVQLNPRLDVAGCSSVSIDNYRGAFTLVTHLIELGHRSIAIIKGPRGNVDADERLRGYQDALAQAGISSNDELEFQGEFTESSGYRLTTDVLALGERPTAIFAANDCMAVGVLSALDTLGIEVPDDMAVAGFDDVTIARFMSPPLTTVSVDAFELGSRAVHLAIAASESPQRKVETIGAELVVRRSCGAERRAATPSSAECRDRTSKPTVRGTAGSRSPRTTSRRQDRRHEP